jgi:CBS domain-containing protein
LRWVRASATALDVAIRAPDVLPASATAADVRTYFSNSQKVHMALVVDDGGRLLSAILRSDVGRELEARIPAVELGTLRGRTVTGDHPADALAAWLDDGGDRRLAVLSDEGVLLGLVCRKASRTGFCTDEDVQRRRS